METSPKTRAEELNNLPRVKKLIQNFTADLSSSVASKKERAEKNLAKLRDPDSLESYFEERLALAYDSEDVKTLESIQRINGRYGKEAPKTVNTVGDIEINIDEGSLDGAELERVTERARGVLNKKIEILEDIEKIFDSKKVVDFQKVELMYQEVLRLGTDDHEVYSILLNAATNAGDIPKDLVESWAKYKTLATMLRARMSKERLETPPNPPEEAQEIPLDQELDRLAGMASVPERSVNEDEPSEWTVEKEMALQDFVASKNREIDEYERRLSEIENTLQRTRKFEELNSEYAALKKELEETPESNSKKRKKIREEIRDVNQEILLLDKEVNPFKYFLLSKIDKRQLLIMFNKETVEDITLEDINDMLGEEGEKHRTDIIIYDIIKADYYTTDMASTGHSMQLDNIDDVIEDNQIKVDSPKARYTLVGPDWGIIDDNLSYEEARRLLVEKSQDYRSRMLGEFKS